jgi:succinate-acetate transporter protein
MATSTATPSERAALATGRGVKFDQAGPSRFIADPAGLGLAGFALSTMVLSVVNIGLLPKADAPVALGLALAYGGGVQLLAGMWAFIKNDTFAAVALSSYGGFWISFYVLEKVLMPQIPAADQAGALTLYLACWGFFSFYMWLASFRVSAAINAVFITLWPAYLFLALGKSIGSTTLFEIGGGFGMATALAAWYASAAIVLNKTFLRPVLPVGEFRAPQQDTATGPQAIAAH